METRVLTTLALTVAGAALVVLLWGGLRLRRSQRLASQLSQELEALKPFAGIPDAKAYADSLRSAGEELRRAATIEAKTIVDNANNQASEFIRAAELSSAGIADVPAQALAAGRAYGARIVADGRAQARQIVEAAQADAVQVAARGKTLVEDAERRAKDIAGQALAAVRNAEHAWQTAQNTQLLAGRSAPQPQGCSISRQPRACASSGARVGAA